MPISYEERKAQILNEAGISPEPVRPKQLTVETTKKRKFLTCLGASSNRALLVREDNLSDFLIFHYNPPEFSDAETAEYSDGETKGLARPIKQYTRGGDRTVSFQLFFNTFGRKRNDPYQKTVEESIKWLREVKSPVVQSTSTGGKVPPRLYFIWGQLPPFRCILTSMNVVRTVFDPKTKEALRATADITLIEYIDAPL
ncbi:MAG: hypothetical protein AB1349_01610 [Elusimicrobiota bacterium]